MITINAGYEILDEINGEEVLKKLEKIARVCYKSEDKIKEGSAEKMVRSLIKHGHHAMLEHFSFSVKFTVDRGVSHEIVRHRMASYAQESTRYCNYLNKGMVFIEPFYLNTATFKDWETSCKMAEVCYNDMINRGATPEQARCVLPTSIKTELVMTANLREWRHFFELRAIGTTGKPHPQMKAVALPLLEELKTLLPVIFDDLEVFS